MCRFSQVLCEFFCERASFDQVMRNEKIRFYEGNKLKHIFFADTFLKTYSAREIPNVLSSLIVFQSQFQERKNKRRLIH